MSGLRHRMQSEVEIDSEGSWAISYGDMITLLLTFFVLFFSIDKNKEKSESINRSLITELRELQRDEPMLEQRGGEDPSMNLGPDKGKGIEKKVVDQWGAKIYQVGHRVVVDFPGVSFFDLGAIQVNSAGKEIIEKFVELYTPYAGSYNLGVRAFADTRKVSVRKGRRFQDNLELSALRSVATMRVLQGFGIPLAKMSVGGFGELELAQEKQEQSKEKFNDRQAVARKVVFVIEPKLEGES